ncbi:hypothetical protein H5410_058564 [Solanum commersonii]|uniref:Uncharacterized protein n=1 Tax=Solanum commersonii TaxID=4109 RepID=A0A9J5WU03_SOLCO|nr:hypothetical protein H5410_058564 [Solanum commersonii]
MPASIIYSMLYLIDLKFDATALLHQFYGFDVQKALSRRVQPKFSIPASPDGKKLTCEKGLKFNFRCFQVSAVLIPEVFWDERQSYDYMDSQPDINARVRASNFSGRLNYLKKMDATLLHTVARWRETF